VFWRPLSQIVQAGRTPRSMHACEYPPIDVTRCMPRSRIRGRHAAILAPKDRRYAGACISASENAPSGQSVNKPTNGG
jgi:hypothetical protein